MYNNACNPKCCILVNAEMFRMLGEVEWLNFYLMSSSYPCLDDHERKHCSSIYISWKVVWLCDPMDCSPPGSSAHEILQARILERAAIPFSRGSSWPRDWTWVSHTSGWFFILNHQGKQSKEFIIRNIESWDVLLYPNNKLIARPIYLSICGPILPSIMYLSCNYLRIQKEDDYHKNTNLHGSVNWKDFLQKV